MSDHEVKLWLVNFITISTMMLLLFWKGDPYQTPQEIFFSPQVTLILLVPRLIQAQNLEDYFDAVHSISPGDVNDPAKSAAHVPGLPQYDRLRRIALRSIIIFNSLLLAFNC